MVLSVGTLDVSVIIGLVDPLIATLRGLLRNVELATAMTENMTFVGNAVSQVGARIVAPSQEAVGLAMLFTLTGFGDGIDGVWILASVEHRIYSNGYQTTCEGERGD
jgi:hypothetical protein